MSVKLTAPRPVDNLLRRMSPWYTVASELARLDTAPVRGVSATTFRWGSVRFKQLIGAERLKRRLAQQDLQLTALRGDELQQAEYETLLNRQLSTAKALYDVLRRVHRSIVRRPDGTFVRVNLHGQMDKLYERMDNIRDELESSKRPQDT